jgi:hypothetical protein
LLAQIRPDGLPQSSRALSQAVRRVCHVAVAVRRTTRQRNLELQPREVIHAPRPPPASPCCPPHRSTPLCAPRHAERAEGPTLRACATRAQQHGWVDQHRPRGLVQGGGEGRAAAAAAGLLLIINIGGGGHSSQGRIEVRDQQREPVNCHATHLHVGCWRAVIGAAAQRGSQLSSKSTQHCGLLCERWGGYCPPCTQPHMHGASGDRSYQALRIRTKRPLESSRALPHVVVVLQEQAGCA